MTSNKPKYQAINEEHYPINGNMIKYHLSSNKLNKTQVAKDMNILPTTLYKYFKQDSLQLGILWKLSKAVNHNFLAQMSEYLQIPFETQAEKKLKAQLAEKNELINKMEVLLAIYEKIVMK
ncbi:transcriptional regulator [Flavobacterium sp. HJJ]|uniref:transcriptional regulator n=1 Tax=Flavobacterium sp. HJJ TaxID=2783792 RepID=UPI00188A23CB|nr:transcriptional regulator [Flavobacterium sp. HJJ]MBF4471079.1 transcriptional regulator [Flavobacterium sp. HJJ]